MLTIFSAAKEVYKEKVVSSGIFMSPVTISVVGAGVIAQQIFPQKLMSKRLQHDGVCKVIISNSAWSYG